MRTHLDHYLDKWAFFYVFFRTECLSYWNPGLPLENIKSSSRWDTKSPCWDSKSLWWDINLPRRDDIPLQRKTLLSRQGDLLSRRSWAVSHGGETKCYFHGTPGHSHAIGKTVGAFRITVIWIRDISFSGWHGLSLIDCFTTLKIGTAGDSVFGVLLDILYIDRLNRKNTNMMFFIKW